MGISAIIACSSAQERERGEEEEKK